MKLAKFLRDFFSGVKNLERALKTLITFISSSSNQGVSYIISYKIYILLEMCKRIE